MHIPVSVLILTKNEQQDLPGCLESAAWSDDVHVFDSFSTDDTVGIAAAFGARVTQRAFDNYAAQRNAALHSLPYAHSWLLLLDADERVPSALAEEIALFVGSAPPDVAGGRIRRRDFLLGTWLKHAQISPYYIRLVRPAQAHYERAINEVMKVDGQIHEFQNPFDHHPFSKGMAFWVEKHNLYSTLEAQQVIRSRQGQEPFVLSKAFFCRDFNERRFHQKELFYRLPARPLLKFFLVYVLKRGFLDGQAGLMCCLLQSIYEYMIVCKTREADYLQKLKQTQSTGVPA